MNREAEVSACPPMAEVTCAERYEIFAESVENHFLKGVFEI